jgi:hypothetical protein
MPNSLRTQRHPPGDDMTATPDAPPFSCPDAPITGIHTQTNYRGVIAIVHIVCPWCGHTHTHGIGNPNQPTLGHRLAHCIPTGTDTYTLHSYVLTDPNGVLP